MKKSRKLKAQRDLFSCKGMPLTRISRMVIIMVFSLFLGHADVFAKKSNSQKVQTSNPQINLSEGENATNVASQQTLSVSGKVTDSSSLPLPGVTVVVKGTVKGTITGNDGLFSISNIPNNTILVFSFVGMKPQEIAVSGKSKINVVMEEESIGLDEVVAIGYGSLKKKEISSSIVNISKENFQKGAASGPMALLVGKVAGLNVDPSGSSPGSTASIQIRGATSVTAGNSPLIVIDGIAGGGDMNNIATQDIESITVLKDGASAAIYGTRGANGVILITTKRSTKGGGANSLNVTYDSYFAINSMHKLQNVLSYEEYLDPKYKRAQTIDFGAHDDWLGALKRDFSSDNNQYLAITGSTSKSNYSVSINYIDKTGLDKANAREQYGIRAALSQKTLNDLLEINASVNVSAVDAKTGSNGIGGTATMNPTVPIWNPDGTYNHPTTSTGATNAVENANDITTGNIDNYILGTLEAKLQLIKTAKQTLTTAVSYSMDFHDSKYSYYLPSTHATSSWNGYKGSATLRDQRWLNKQFEWTVNYSFSAGSHSLRAVAGYSFSEDSWETMSMTNYDFTFDQFLYNSIGSGTWLTAGKAGMSSDKNSSRLVGLFGRVNYSWKELLTATASLRYEGSSQFGINKKWGYFPAVSGSWEISKMPFMANFKDKISSLKLRASYGVTGRRAGSNYQSLQTYTSRGTSYYMDGAWVPAYAPSKNANYNLAWELGISSDIGIDFDIFKRLRGSVEYFDRRSENLLYNYTAPQPPFVYNSILLNLGSTKNTGIEVSLDGDIMKKKNFSWVMSARYYTGKTILTKLSNELYSASYIDIHARGGAGSSEYFFRLTEGSKVGEVYGYEDAGVDATGQLMVWSKAGVAILKTAATNTDKKYIGNTAPKHVFSWTNSFKYKNWDVNIFCRGAAGMKMWNGQLFNIGLKGSTANNVLKTAFTKYNDITSDGAILSSFFLEKGDWLSVDRLSVGYNFPLKKKAVKSLYCYLSANNLHTFTSFTGVDPSTVQSIGLDPGISGDTVLLTTQFTFGTTIKF
ncbi:MAG: SusC/RagA family TonB-linked outer membrane protein [Prolixibacteraceae bacterium]